jgi:hypothetical protein
MVQVVKCLPSNHEALNSKKPSTAKRRKKEKKKSFLRIKRLKAFLITMPVYSE